MKNNSILTCEKRDRELSLYIYVYFFATILNIVIKNSLPLPENLWGGLSMFFGVLIMFFLLNNIKTILKRQSALFFGSYAFFILIITFSIVLATLRGESFDFILSYNAFNVLFFWVPIGVAASSIENKEVLYDTFVKGSYVLSLLLTYNFVVKIGANINGEDESLYDMSFGFSMLIPLLFQLNEFFKKKRILLLLFIVVQTAMLLTYANRGVLLSLVFFVAYKFFHSSTSRSAKIIKTLLLLLVVVIIIFGKEIFAFFAELLFGFGLQSRTITMLIDNEITDTSGRDELWKICANLIEEKPLFGWGFGGEYYQIAASYSHGSTNVQPDGHNPHNGIIQFFVEFGILGGIIATYIFLLPLLRLKLIKDKSRHDLVLISGAAALIPFCVSTANFVAKPILAIYVYLFFQSFLSKKKKTKGYEIKTETI